MNCWKNRMTIFMTKGCLFALCTKLVDIDPWCKKKFKVFQWLDIHSWHKLHAINYHHEGSEKKSLSTSAIWWHVFPLTIWCQMSQHFLCYWRTAFVTLTIHCLKQCSKYKNNENFFLPVFRMNRSPILWHNFALSRCDTLASSFCGALPPASHRSPSPWSSLERGHTTCTECSASPSHTPYRAQCHIEFLWRHRIPESCK